MCRGTTHPAAVEALLRAAERLPEASEAYWCAGAGVVGSSHASCHAEVAVLEGFLTRWDPRPAGNGFFLASSAGGVYAGSSGPPFTEHTEPAAIRRTAGRSCGRRRSPPTSPYAPRARCSWEDWRTSTAPARTSTNRRDSSRAVPGPALRQPLSVYVPLDTMRDYLFVDDAAAMTVAGLSAVFDWGRRALKVLASERSTTVGAVLGDLHRVTRHPRSSWASRRARATRCTTCDCVRWHGHGRRRSPGPLWFRGSRPRSRQLQRSG